MVSSDSIYLRRTVVRGAAVGRDRGDGGAGGAGGTEKGGGSAADETGDKPYGGEHEPALRKESDFAHDSRHRSLSRNDTTLHCRAGAHGGHCRSLRRIMPPLAAYLNFSLFTLHSSLQKRRLPCGRRLFCICYTKSGKFFTTAAQRGHSSGCWASLPTVGSTFQQRRHLAPLAGRTATVSSLPTSTRT